ncbi:MAG: glycosyltransferase [Paludibacteraceae bacterium]|nr:glycosyltransferase [Paludibacteraceae bacterium]
MELAPIIVFAYNRPDHLERTLDALSRNELANESTLYIYCDGPKSGASTEQISQIEAVREVAKSVKGFKDIHIACADKNKGLANSVISGVTEVIEKWGKVIVVEDDLVTAPDFLYYMNAVLDHYEKFPAVFSVTGDRPPIDRMTIPEDYEYDVFVNLRSWSYGWGTWKDKWMGVDWDMPTFEEYIKRPRQIEAFSRCGDDVHRMLLMQRNHQIDSWAIRFSYAHFINHAVAIMPVHSYITHIGFDGSGTHCSSTNINNEMYVHSKDIRFLDVIYEDSRIINAFYNYYCRKKRPLWQKAINYIYRKLGKNPPFVIKKKIYC